MLMLVVVTLLLLILSLWFIMKPFYWKRKGIPYSLPLPFFGSALGAVRKSFNEHWGSMYNNANKDRGIYGFHNFLKPSILITNKEALKEVMVTHYYNFSSRGMYCNPEHDTLARNVAHVAGDEWKSLRTKLSPYFSPSRMKYITPMMLPNIQQFNNELEKAAKLFTDVDVNKLSMKLATDVVTNTVFGVEGDSFTNPNSFFLSLQREFFKHSFILRMLLGTLSPTLYNLFKMTIIPEKTSLELKAFVENVLRQRINNIGVRPDFIQGMLELIEKYGEGPHNQDQDKFRKEDATAQCMIMFMAGTDTTGNSMGYLLYELAAHQHIQDRVRREIDQVLAKSPDGVFSYELYKDLHYTNMVINEGLRKYPVLPVVTRECTGDVSVAGVHIEKGASVYIPVMAMHRDPNLYPEPDRFIPERFSKDSSSEPSVYLPFGMGPRACIGMRLALIELAFTLCYVIPKFRFLPSPKTRFIKFSKNATLSPENGIWLKLERI